MNNQTPSYKIKQMDRLIAEQDPCSECGGSCRFGCDYRDKVYKAYAICNDCGHVEEF